MRKTRQCTTKQLEFVKYHFINVVFNYLSSFHECVEFLDSRQNCNILFQMFFYIQYTQGSAWQLLSMI